MRKIMFTEEQYYRDIERAWAWYDHNISYRSTTYEVELVTLKGNYAGKTAIKIPIERDCRDFRSYIEGEFAEMGRPISIRKYVFTSELSSFGEPRQYRTYLYMPL